MSDDDELPNPEEDAEFVAQALSRDGDNAASVAGARGKKNRIAREAEEADDFWRNVLGSKIGRREMWRLIAGDDAGHAFQTRFPAGAVGFPDANAAWYERGAQDFCLRLYQSWLQRDPAAVAKMHEENDKRFQKPGVRRVS